MTLLEVLVAIGIIALLLAILIPAVSAARESSRRTSCQSNLHQIGAAFHAYEGTRRKFPRTDFTFDILPYIEQEAVHKLFPEPRDPNSDFDALVARIDPYVIPLYYCPSDPAPETYGDPADPKGHPVARTNYVGNIGSGFQKYGDNGFFPFYGMQYRAADFPKGLSNTAAVAETLCPFPDASTRLRTVWEVLPMTQPTQLDAFADACERLPPSPADYGYRGLADRGTPWHGKLAPNISYNHVLPPNHPNCSNGGWTVGSCYPANSMHAAGANVLYGDGHVEFASESVDRQVWREVGSRVSLSEASPSF